MPEETKFLYFEVNGTNLLKRRFVHEEEET